jgi:hypothetical protein
MDIKDLRAEIGSSELSEGRKKEILTLLDGEITPDIGQKIKNLIQEDIDDDMAPFLTKEDKEKIAKAGEQMSADLIEVEKELAKNIKFAEDEMSDLKQTVSELNKVADQVQINSLKTDLTSL